LTDDKRKEGGVAFSGKEKGTYGEESRRQRRVGGGSQMAKPVGDRIQKERGERKKRSGGGEANTKKDHLGFLSIRNEPKKEHGPRSAQQCLEGVWKRKDGKEEHRRRGKDGKNKGERRRRAPKKEKEIV